MEFTFSDEFCKSNCEQVLHHVGEYLNAYREIAGITMKELMTAQHISYPTLKKC